MSTIFIISSDLTPRDKAALDAVFRDKYHHIPRPERGPSQDEAQWVFHTFQSVCDEIEGKIDQHGGVCALRNAIALIELKDPDLGTLGELSPMFSVSHAGWTMVTAMLVLAFPELHWVFKTDSAPRRSPLFAEAHVLEGGSVSVGSLKKISELNAQGFTPLFDPTGLRDAIRQNVARSPDGGYVPVREESACSIDEEADYAYLHAHAAYRFGYRCQVLSSYGMTARIFGRGMSGGGVSLVFEDVYLNFPDKTPDPELHLSRIRQRDTLLPGLSKVDRRVFVTVGHEQREKDQETWTDNHQYIQSLRDSGKHCKTIYKPGSGIFDVWKSAGLPRAAGYEWPPRQAAAGGELAGGHSAHGRLLAVAVRLARRSDRVLESARAVPEAVHGAVLALDAQEYLGHRTPTSSLEALALKHQNEVLAECMFYGVEYNMDVLSRFKEIDKDVDSISVWFQQNSRVLSKLNAEIRINSELLKMFREHSQFDEEQKTLNRIRTLHRRLWFRRNMWWAWLGYPVRWYVEFLLGSLLRYVLALAVWIAVLTFFYYYFHVLDELSGNQVNEVLEYLRASGTEFWHGFSDALTVFLGMQPPHDIKQLIIENRHMARWIVAVTAIGVVSSFVHLGIFISHLYSMISRK